MIILNDEYEEDGSSYVSIHMCSWLSVTFTLPSSSSSSILQMMIRVPTRNSLDATGYGSVEMGQESSRRHPVK